MGPQFLRKKFAQVRWPNGLIFELLQLTIMHHQTATAHLRVRPLPHEPHLPPHIIQPFLQHHQAQLLRGRLRRLVWRCGEPHGFCNVGY